MNGLDDTYSGTGNQTFGAGKSRLDKYGRQVVVGTSVGTKYFYDYAVTSFRTGDPSLQFPLLTDGAYITATALQKDTSAWLDSTGFGRNFVYSTSAPTYQAGSSAVRDPLGTPVEANGYAYIDGTGDGHFFIKPAMLLASLTADPAGVADGMVWYRSDTDKLFLRANGATVQITTGGGGMKVSGSGYQVMPSAAAGIDPAVHATAWTSGTYSEVLASTSEADYILGVTYNPVNGSTEGEIDIATGGAGAETVVSTISGAQGGAFNAVAVMLPYPIAVATSTRVAVRQRSSANASSHFQNVKLIYCKQSDLVSL